MTGFELFAVSWIAATLVLALTAGIAELRSRGYNPAERRIRALRPLSNSRKHHDTPERWR